MLVFKEHFHLSYWSKALIYALGILIFCCLCIPLQKMMFYTNRDSTELTRKNLCKLEQKQTSVERLLEENIFNAQKNRLLFALPEVGKNLLFLSAKKRPDSSSSSDLALLGLLGKEEKKWVEKQERVYLHCDDEYHMEFSEHRTPFWVEAVKQGDGCLELKFCADFTENEESLFSCVKNIILAEKKGHNQDPVFQTKEFSQIIDFLKLCKIYTPDVFLQELGGETFKSLKGKYRMQSSQEKSPIFFIERGSNFVWEDQALFSSANLEGKIVVSIAQVNNKNCECLIWDKEGLFPYVLNLPIVSVRKSSLNFADIFGQIQQRTHSSVLALLNGKNTILRVGDWLLKSSNHWKPISYQEELKEYLQGSLEGELFIFDAILEKEGKKMFKGRYFNKERTYMQECVQPISDKKDSRQKKGPAGKIVENNWRHF